MKKYSLILVVFISGCITGTQAPAPVVEYGRGAGAGSAGIHTVLDGDTVYKVAEKYNLPMVDIITVNSLSAPYVLNVGYRMKLPPPREYKVKSGDSISSIARMFEVSASALARQNDLISPFTISQGQVLRLPSKSSQAVFEPEVETQEPVQVAAVQKENLNAVPAPKPTVEKASAARPSLPKTTPKRSGNGKFMRPVEGQLISRYGPKKGGLYNDGINIKVPRGTPVRAAENGVVVYAGDQLEGYGNLVLVRHEGRYMSAYAHLDKILIKRGDTLKRGQSLGTVGSTGQVDTPQLHFEIRRGTKALNPEKYL